MKTVVNESGVVRASDELASRLVQKGYSCGHIWWSNFEITPIEHGTRGHRGGTVETLQDRKAINLDKYSIGNKRQILRNCVEPEVGKHVFLCAF